MADVFERIVERRQNGRRRGGFAAGIIYMSAVVMDIYIMDMVSLPFFELDVLYKMFGIAVLYAAFIFIVAFALWFLKRKGPVPDKKAFVLDILWHVALYYIVPYTAFNTLFHMACFKLNTENPENALFWSITFFSMWLIVSPLVAIAFFYNARDKVLDKLPPDVAPAENDEGTEYQDDDDEVYELDGECADDDFADDEDGADDDTDESGGDTDDAENSDEDIQER